MILPLQMQPADGAEAVFSVTGFPALLIMLAIGFLAYGWPAMMIARRAGKLAPKMRIMFITGFAAVALNKKGPGPAEAKVLSKPFHLKDLVAEVDRALVA